MNIQINAWIVKRKANDHEKKNIHHSNAITWVKMFPTFLFICNVHYSRNIEKKRIKILFSRNVGNTIE